MSVDGLIKQVSAVCVAQLAGTHASPLKMIVVGDDDEDRRELQQLVSTRVG